jgi:hypothetical protein
MNKIIKPKIPKQQTMTNGPTLLISLYRINRVTTIEMYDPPEMNLTQELGVI